MCFVCVSVCVCVCGGLGRGRERDTDEGGSRSNRVSLCLSLRVSPTTRKIRHGNQEGICTWFPKVGRGFGIIIRGLGMRLFPIRIDYFEIIAVLSPTVPHVMCN